VPTRRKPVYKITYPNGKIYVGIKIPHITARAEGVVRRKA
jgi:hypothetical protein